ncbi:MAG TPA: DUF4097 family beta strand repeat-containing protein [Candidatus Limnocylindrales bacterium]|nr:DUF4097 family beta strand repeat-containing protein [Candidatus Limnocylindrales bacterium]
MVKLKGTLAVVLSLCAVQLLQAKSIGISHAEFRHSYQLGPGGRLVLQNLYGDVSITAWDRDEVLVEAFKHSADPRRLDDAVIVVEPSTGLLSIRTQYAGSDASHPAQVEYRITVPRTTHLEQVNLINGGLSISGVSGPVKASAVNGSIHADRLEGDTELSTINGQLIADFDRVSAKRPITLSSVNGPIRLSLPPCAHARLEATNRSGGIESDIGHVSRAQSGQELHTTVNNGGAEIHVKNVNGGISIHSSWNRRKTRATS